MSVGTASAAAPPKNQLVLWLAADSGGAKDGSTWADKSAQGHNDTAIVGEAPAFVAYAINGLPAAQFSGRRAMIIAGQFLTSQPFTVIAPVTDTDLNDGPGPRGDMIPNWSQSAGPESIYIGAATQKVPKKNKTPVDRSEKP